jgi:hypothetical protein
MADPERLAGLAVQLAAIAGPVIGHQPLDDDALRGEPGDSALQKADGLVALAVEDLDVGQAGAVIDSDVEELPADPATGRGPVVVDPVARPADPP